MTGRYPNPRKRFSTAPTHASVDCRRGRQTPGTVAKNSDACVGEAGLDALMAAACALWPVKTAAQLAHCAGASERRAEQWLERSANPSAAAVIRLLHSDHGEAFFAALITAPGRAPAWFAAREKALRMAALRRELERLERGDG